MLNSAYAGKNDDELMESFQQGDAVAFEALYHRYKTPIFSFAYRYTNNTNDAEDIAQQTFLKLFQAHSQYKKLSNFKSWLYAIARNLAVDMKKSAWSRKVDINTPETDDASKNARPEWEKKEIAAIVQAAVNALSEDQREVFILSKYQDLSYNEIAEICGCSTDAVKQRIFRSHQILKEKLARFVEV
ncbi:MAG: RNA polymerase sigma factor [Planctomycetes bacterium]|nr:RNA polymerase sigma factor [Planctomycetota bacterium]